MEDQKEQPEEEKKDKTTFRVRDLEPDKDAKGGKRSADPCEGGR